MNKISLKILFKTLYLWVLFVLLSTSSLVFANIQVITSNNSVVAGEIFTIRFIYSGGNLKTNPDFSPLNQSFEILNSSQSRSSSIQIINGVRSEETQSIYNLSVVAKTIGIVKIPEIQFNGEKSRPQVIQVLPNPTAGADDFYFDIDEYQNESYVFEQFMISYTFYHSESLARPNFIAPKFEGVDVEVETLPQSQGQIQRNGRVYGFVNQKFLITPKQSGILRVNPFSFTGFINNNRQIRIFQQSEPLNITIKSIPNGIAANRWFPAKKVQLFQSFGNLTGEIQLGSPIIREIELQANSVGSAQIPNFEYTQSNDLSIYPDQIQITRDNNNRLIAKQSYTIIPSKVGDIKIPEFRFYWWDLESNEMKIATLAARIIRVVDNQTNQTNQSNQSNQTNQISQTNIQNSLNNQNNQTSQNNLGVDLAENQFINNQSIEQSNQFNFWIISILGSSLIFALAGLLFILLKLKKINQKISSQSNELSKANEKYMASEKVKIKTAQEAINQIKIHLADNQLSEAYTELMRFKKLWIQSHSIAQLDDLIGSDFAKIRSQIEANLYNNQTHQIDYQKFVQLMLNFIKKYQKNQSKREKHSLAQL